MSVPIKTINFLPHQIVCLEYGDACLYAEVIQVVTSRGVAWVRPLLLTTLTSELNPLGARPFEGSEPLTLCDLREGADLLWPLRLLRVALDTEVIPLLTQLQSLDIQTKDAMKAHRQLRDFVGKVWQAYPDAFMPSNL